MHEAIEASTRLPLPGVMGRLSKWSEFFRWSTERGLHGVDLVVSDHHGGLINTVLRHFHGVMWQRCQVHFMRNILDSCRMRYQEELKAKLWNMFNASDIKAARNLLDDIVLEFPKKHLKPLRAWKADSTTRWP